MATPRVQKTHIKSINATTSTGPGVALHGFFGTVFGMQIRRTSTGTVTVQLEGTIGGTTVNNSTLGWANIGSANSAATAGFVTVKSTSTLFYTQLRARVTAHSAPGAVTVWVTGS